MMEFMLHLAREKVKKISDVLNITFMDDDVYEVTKNKIKEFFEPQKNTQYKTFLFRSACQAAGEKVIINVLCNNKS